MPSPFPGIDPYLESQHFWEDLHPSFLLKRRSLIRQKIHLVELDLLLAVAAALLTNYPIRLNKVRPDDLCMAFVQGCVLAPIFEEAIYRFGFCTGSVPVLGPWGTIVASGMIFCALQVLYGNPALDNLIAGYFLAWSYLKSGTIIVPAVLHSLGNVCVLVMHFGTWYWQHGIA